MPHNKKHARLLPLLTIIQQIIFCRAPPASSPILLSKVPADVGSAMEKHPPRTLFERIHYQPQLHSTVVVRISQTWISILSEARRRDLRDSDRFLGPSL